METETETTEAPTPIELPEGDYAIVEMMGHRTMVGRISEAEKFGAKFLSLEPVWQDALLPAVLIGGPSIYALTPCDAATARRRQPTHRYSLPAAVLATLAPEALPAPENHVDEPFIADDDDDDGMPF